jgi:hypothetical protein
MYRYHPILGQRLEDIKNIYLSRYKLNDTSETKSIIIDNNGNTGGYYVFTPYVSNLLEEENTSLVETDHIYPGLYWQRLDLFKKELDRLIGLNYQIRVITKHFDALEDENLGYIANNPQIPFYLKQMILCLQV